MINFLRKIRKKLMNKGKVKSYLLYSSGEIILVVIGILIALQINNWNEENKDKQLEEITYCKLLEDVSQDELQLKNLVNDNVQRLKSNKEMIRLLQATQVDKEKELSFKISMPEESNSFFT